MNSVLNVLLSNKIKESKKILNLDNKNQNIDKKFIENKNIIIKNSIDLENENELYDIVICYDFFSKKKDLEKLKKILSKNGNIIFIEKLVTNYIQYKYHPLSYISLVKPVYISDVFDELRYNDLVIVDFDRVYNIDIWTYPIEYFSIICEIKI